jgi:hypothetical protein
VLDAAQDNAKAARPQFQAEIYLAMQFNALSYPRGLRFDRLSEEVRDARAVG